MSEEGKSEEGKSEGVVWSKLTLSSCWRTSGVTSSPAQLMKEEREKERGRRRE